MKGALFDYNGTLVHEIFYCRHSLVCAGFNLWKSILPEKAFFGEGSPSVIMTDDSDAERAALAACFPTSRLLLCQFHVLQASAITLTVLASCYIEP